MRIYSNAKFQIGFLTRSIMMSIVPYCSLNIYILLQNPSSDMTRAGRILRTLILTRSPGLVRDRRQQARTFRRCLVGAEMVDWLLAIGSASGIVKSRHQATGMWQALLEEGIIQHGKFKVLAKKLFYYNQQ